MGEEESGTVDGRIGESDNFFLREKSRVGK